MRKVAVALLLLVLLSATALHAAQTLRCDGNVVSLGDIKFEVVSKCGEPAFKETRQKEREVVVFNQGKGTFESLRVTVTIDEWTYNFGPGGFLYVVTLEDGKVVSIESAGFGR
jgi:Protein of unknown function (DUF2845)